MRLFSFSFSKNQEQHKETVTIPRDAFVDLMQKFFQAGGAIHDASVCVQKELKKKGGRKYNCLGRYQTAAELNDMISHFSDDLNRRSCDFFKEYYLK